MARKKNTPTKRAEGPPSSSHPAQKKRRRIALTLVSSSVGGSSSSSSSTSAAPPSSGAAASAATAASPFTTPVLRLRSEPQLDFQFARTPGTAVRRIDSVAEFHALMREETKRAVATSGQWVRQMTTPWIQDLLQELDADARAVVQARSRRLELLEIPDFDFAGRWAETSELASTVLHQWFKGKTLDDVAAKAAALGHMTGDMHAAGGLVLEGDFVRERLATARSLRPETLLPLVSKLATAPPPGQSAAAAAAAAAAAGAPPRVSLYRVKRSNTFALEAKQTMLLSELRRHFGETDEAEGQGMVGCGSLNTTFDYAGSYLRQSGVPLLDEFHETLQDVLLDESDPMEEEEAQDEDEDDGTKSESIALSVGGTTGITHTPAAKVTEAYKTAAASWPVWDSSTHPQTPAGSGKFHFDYTGDYATERALLLSGRATLTPDDGSPPVTLVAGDAVSFHKGFACQWHVHETVTKHYAYFDAAGRSLTSTVSTLPRLNERMYLIWKTQTYATSHHQDTHVPPHFTLYNQLSGASVFHFVPILIGLFLSHVGQERGPEALRDCMARLDAGDVAAPPAAGAGAGASSGGKSAAVGSVLVLRPGQVALILPCGAHGVFVPAVASPGNKEHLKPFSISAIRAAEFLIAPTYDAWHARLSLENGGAGRGHDDDDDDAAVAATAPWNRQLSRTEAELKKMADFAAVQQKWMDDASADRDEWFWCAKQVLEQWQKEKLLKTQQQQKEQEEEKK